MFIAGRIEIFTECGTQCNFIALLDTQFFHHRRELSRFASIQNAGQRLRFRFDTIQLRARFAQRLTARGFRFARACNKLFRTGNHFLRRCQCFRTAVDHDALFRRIEQPADLFRDCSDVALDRFHLDRKTITTITCFLQCPFDLHTFCSSFRTFSRHAGQSVLAVLQSNFRFLKRACSS